MRELIVTEFLSLDGVMQAPGGEPGYPHTGWVADHFSDELGEVKLAEQLEADVLLLGRRTYESFAGAWPHRDGPMAEKINTMRKVVVSGSADLGDWAGTEVVTSDPLGAVRALKDEDGGPILLAGSRTLAQALLRAGLVDEVRLQVMPVVLGSGDRLWPQDPEVLPVRLESSKALANGVLLLAYRTVPRG